MSSKNVILKPSKGLILPEEIPVAEAIRRGLALPGRRVMGANGKRISIPPVPAGLGVFAKFGVQVINARGSEALAKCDEEAQKIRDNGIDERAAAALEKCDQRRAKIIALHVVRLRNPRTGKMVRKIERPVHSFTRNFGQFIRGFLQNADGASLNINETLVDDNGASFLCRLKSNGGIASNIVIVSGLAKMKFGNSNAALSTTQFNLQGVLLGPTTEATVVVALVVEDSTNTIFTATGQITNGTGGAFSVEEMGLFSELGSTTGVANNTTMMLRDLTGTVNVNNGQTIIGVYTFTIAV